MGCNFDISSCVVLGIALWNLVMYYRPPVAERRSVCCISFKIPSLGGVFGFATCLTRWADNSRLSIKFLLLLLWLWCICVGVGDCGRTVAISRCVFRVCNLFFLFLQLTAVIFVIYWSIKWWNISLGFLTFLFTGLLCLLSAHQASKLVNFCSRSKSVTMYSISTSSKWTWLVQFCRCGGTLAYIDCSMMA